jgi:hypothetical protein
MNLFTRFRGRLDAKKRRPSSVRLELELLEARNLLSGSTLGPLGQVTSTDPFASSTADNPASQPGTFSPSSEVEPYLAVNPTNPKNLVGAWMQDEWSAPSARGIGIAVSFNGGNSWKTSVMQGLTLVAGGTTYERAADVWLAFAPNGDLYFTSLVYDVQPNGSFSPSAVVVEKSTDGGLDWSAPITLIQSATTFNDKDSITTDPARASAAYAVWDQNQSGYNSVVMFSRTTDGGHSWSAPSTIFDPGGNNLAFGNQIRVLPNGTLTDFVNIVPFQTGHHTMTLSLVQSSDQGNTWSKKATTVGSILSIGITDPNNAQPVDAASLFGPSIDFSVAEDPNNGSLYAVWQDARFSNFQHDSIAFSMSTDGGLTWSAPIQINQTPTNLPNGDQQAFLPSIAVAANGTVAVSYYDFRFNGTGPGLLTDYWLVQGRAGTDLTNPANWSNEARLTNTSFNMEAASVRGGYFIGDYEGLAAVGNDFDAFFAATNGSDPGDIFFRDPSAAVTFVRPMRPLSITVAAADGAVGESNFADALALVAGLSPLVPGQAFLPMPAATAQAELAVPPLAPPAIDLFFSAAGKEDSSAALAAALHGSSDGPADEWDTLLDQALCWQDSTAVFPPAAR